MRCYTRRQGPNSTETHVCRSPTTLYEKSHQKWSLLQDLITIRYQFLPVVGDSEPSQQTVHAKSEKYSKYLSLRLDYKASLVELLFPIDIPPRGP